GHDRLPYEWAVVCVFCALLSPLCWKQHLVLALPVLMLVAKRFLTSEAGQRALAFFLAASMAAVWMSRHGIVGRDTGGLFMSLKVDTMVLLLATWLARAAGGRPSVSKSPTSLRGQRTPSSKAFIATRRMTA